jgi:hypothetical protein
MVRILWAIVLASALAASLHGQSPDKPASKKAGGAHASPPVANTIESKIRQAWQDFKDKKKDAFATLLTDDNTQVWADGKPPRDKPTTIKDLDAWTLNSYSLSNINIKPLGGDAAVATYQAKVDASVNGQKVNANLAVTDLWVKRGGEWKELRYHESEIK